LLQVSSIKELLKDLINMSTTSRLLEVPK